MSAAINRRARDEALAAASEVAVEATSLVGFQSQGRLLIIGQAETAQALAASLDQALACCVLATAGRAASASIPIVYSQGRDIAIAGHFGEFLVTVAGASGPINVAQAADRRFSHFDLLLDLGEAPLLDYAVEPLGYYAPRGDADKLSRALAELRELVGEFEKPKYFSYDPDICAHGRSRLSGCRRCLDACPTGAITSLVETVAIDPYYCQGGGSCATACPTGAIVYSYPKPADLANRLRVLLKSYRAAGGSEPSLLFHDSETGKALLESRTANLPGHALLIEVEEVGSVGMDTWLGALAYGAQRVLLLDTPALADSVRRELDEQLAVARAVLQEMGYPADALRLIGIAELDPALNAAAMPDLRPAGFAGSNEKRNTLFFAIDWLYRQAPQQPAVADLPGSAPFGEILVDKQACTLCMACVSVCPAAALEAGGDTPLLAFIEANCVQCGLCESACPEDAITRQPRYQYDRETRMRRRTLNQEAPFYCIACGKAFATRSVIDKMTAKLQDHWMFQDAQAVKRLQMCGDCRVKHLFETDQP